MTAVVPTPGTVTTIGARPADPVTQIRKAADRLLDLPATSLIAAMAGVLTTAAGDMHGRGAYELAGADGEPLVADPSGHRPDWSAALGLARAVLAHRHPDTGLVTFHLHGLADQFDFLRAGIAAIACADHGRDPVDMTRDQLVAEVLALRGALHQATTGHQTGAQR